VQVPNAGVIVYQVAMPTLSDRAECRSRERIVSRFFPYALSADQ